MATVCCDGEKLGEILMDLLNSVDAALVECGAAPCRVFLDVANDPPWDVCCQCADSSIGQLWVTVTEIRNLNSTDAGIMRCVGIFEADVSIGVLRCAVTMDDAGNAPDQDSVSMQTLGILRDRLAINQGIRCVFGGILDDDGLPKYDSDDFTLGDWHSLGPRGACVGGRIDLTVRFADPKCS